jgi:hypothetical protein
MGRKGELDASPASPLPRPAGIAADAIAQDGDRRRDLDRFDRVIRHSTDRAFARIDAIDPVACTCSTGERLNDINLPLAEGVGRLGQHDRHQDAATRCAHEVR